MTLQERITTLLEDIHNTHIYKSSLIYELYNEAYGKKEKVSTCRSCLISRTKLLQKWLENNPLPIKEPADEMEEPTVPVSMDDTVKKEIKKKKNK